MSLVKCTALAGDVKRGQNLEAKAEAEAEAKNNYEKVPNND